MRSVILGLSGPYHELAACLVIDGVVACMVEEERLSRVRHGKAAKIDNGADWASQAVARCLDDAGIDFAAVDHIAYPFVATERLRNIGCDADPTADDWGSEAGERRFVADVLSVEDKIRESVGPSARFRFHSVPHHLAHAASAYLPSPFARAAVLAIDGIGEYDTTWLGLGEGCALSTLQTMGYPHSLGLLWEVVSDSLGFGPYGATKVMGRLANTIGAEGAPVTIIEYSDFNCGFCKKFHNETLSRIIEEYVDSGKVKLSYKHYPFLAQSSLWKAEAAECAAEQGKFWGYHDALFADKVTAQGDETTIKQALSTLASELQLDVNKFNACMSAGKVTALVQADAGEGEQMGVRGTPSFLINGAPLVGAQPYEAFKQAIDAALAAGK